MSYAWCQGRWWIAGVTSVFLHGVVALSFLCEKLPSDTGSAQKPYAYMVEARLVEGRNDEAAMVPDKDPAKESMDAKPGIVLSDARGPRHAQKNPQILYHLANELDSPAQLVGEWYVLAARWPSDVRKIQVRLWISAEGNIDRWEVLEPSSSEKVRESLEWLNYSILNPARMSGRNVASVMDIELSLD